jgi:hypothetical protein
MKKFVIGIMNAQSIEPFSGVCWLVLDVEIPGVKKIFCFSGFFVLIVCLTAQRK